MMKRLFLTILLLFSLTVIDALTRGPVTAQTTVRGPDAPSTGAADSLNVDLIGQIGGASCAVVVSGSYAYVADAWAGLQVINVANHTNPTAVGSYQYRSGYAISVAVSGGYAYIADEHQGLRVINVANPAKPTEVGYYDTPGQARGVVVSSRTYVADGPGGLTILRYRESAKVFLPLQARQSAAALIHASTLTLETTSPNL